MSRKFRWSAILLLAVGLQLACLYGVQRQRAEGADKGQEPTSLGTDVCMVCHIDFASRWARVSHSQKMLSDAAVPKPLRGCEGCHGGGSEHVLGNRQRIVRWEGLSTSGKNNTCLQCHQGKVETEQWKTSPHSPRGTTCDGCHEVHSPTQFDTLLRQDPNKLCLSCHSNVEALAKKKLHHPLVADMLTCVNCHNPHGSPNSKLLKEPKPKICESCHGDDIPKPESHSAEDFLDSHGKQAKDGKKQCTTCHEEKDFCNTCHGGITMPHPEDWTMEGHKKVATFKDDSPCRNCHEKDFCKVCHE